MEYLAKLLRRKLESTAIKARDIAEQAARGALQHLGVGETDAPNHLTENQCAQRRRLRAHGCQLGDQRRPDGHQSIEHLVQETAYEHWHRMLFARFLAESSLLMHPDGVALSLDECEELAPDEGAANGWELAGRYASRMLPQIFRPDSSVLALTLAPEHQRALERLLAGLDPETFQAQDSLGWVYQFWQMKQKEEVNRSEVKIGADELPAVTQLFTEPYMVSFLLDNTLGAWLIATHTDIPPPIQLNYLRLKDDGTPAAEGFKNWPNCLSNFRLLDPSCGSGHFLVAAFHMLVPMRMALEGMDVQFAINAVIQDNLHGLELDQRCIEIAAFSLALSAWRYPKAGGYRTLPDFNLACCGRSIRTKKGDWLDFAQGNHDLENALERLYETYKDAPILGSLINPDRHLKSDLFDEDWNVISPILDRILSSDDIEKSELGVSAKGTAKSSKILTAQYHLVVTNVPYLGRGRQGDRLKFYSEYNYPSAKADLATTFASRCLEFCDKGGCAALVTPQSWLYIGPYRKYRKDMLSNYTWQFIAQLGPRAFETISGEIVNVNLSVITHTPPGNDHKFFGIDASTEKDSETKAITIKTKNIAWCLQSDQITNPDFRISLEQKPDSPLLKKHTNSYKGIATGDINRFIHFFWEINFPSCRWRYLQGSVDTPVFFGGKSQVVLWDNGAGELYNFVSQKLGEGGVGAWLRGGDAWGKKGVAIGQMSGLTCTIYSGELFDENTAVIIPKDTGELLSILSYCESEEYHSAVRAIDSSSLKIPNLTLIKVPFDTQSWSSIASTKYAKGLPKPYSNDPTQWVFHGHPCGLVIWDENAKWTVNGPTNNDGLALQIATSRLLGYKWPSEQDTNMELAEEQRAWLIRNKELNPHVDDDGIVCIPTIRGEKPAAERLLSLLQAAYSDNWSAHKLNQLLAGAGATGKGLDWWLREKFFQQHCKLFHHRPFIWHIWDGLKDGFAALVNYHKLDHKTLETLIYTYLGDWIGLQERAVSDGMDGAGLRLTAAHDLKKRLELILEGETPYDTFVRWKPLEQQPIGWNPNLNDGVRLNIRPFMTAGVLRHNKKPKLNIHWNKDRGKDVESAPWYSLGLEYGGKGGDRINAHHLSLAAKRAAGNSTGG